MSNSHEYFIPVPEKLKRGPSKLLKKWFRILSPDYRIPADWRMRKGMVISENEYLELRKHSKFWLPPVVYRLKEWKR